jgi:hypothetical protein
MAARAVLAVSIVHRAFPMGEELKRKHNELDFVLRFKLTRTNTDDVEVAC